MRSMLGEIHRKVAQRLGHINHTERIAQEKSFQEPFPLPTSCGAGDLGGDAGAVVALGDREGVPGLLVHSGPGYGAEQAQEVYDRAADPGLSGSGLAVQHGANQT
jgi:hypothetical protein